MTDIRRVGDSGVHTVEGAVSGNRAVQLTKQRAQQQQHYESIKNKIKVENASTLQNINNKFSTASDTLEQEFRQRTVGLVSADDFRKARQVMEDNKSTEINHLQEAEKKLQADRLKSRELKRKHIASSLSFQLDDDGNGDDIGSDGPSTGKPLLPLSLKLKDPSVDTSFLPDKVRDKELSDRKEMLSREWLERQEAIKQELLQVVYSYWDGSGHRKAIEVRKGVTVGRFLEMVKQQLVADFSEVRSTSPEDLIYVKEDLIIPHHYSFYDLIITKARGKSGPLFHFDVHDDIRLINDATVEKDESHPGKICERRWYERNKHIFPASRWEVYDPAVSRADQKYTIHGGEIHGKDK